MTFYCQVGQTLRTERRKKKLSQEQLGAFIGAHRNTINRWEQGESTIGLQDFLALCNAMEVSPWSVLPRGVA